MRNLRKLVREIIKEIYHEDEKSASDKELLIEPDEPESEKEENEVSVVAGIAGATTPLGTSSTYPGRSSQKKKKKLPAGWQKA